MSRRSRAREVVMQLLYRDDLNGSSTSENDSLFLAKRLNRNSQLVRFADTILQGVRQHKESIDQQLESLAKNWKLSRMAATDRNVLRIAAWEILHGDTPARVAINEAIDISRRYGDEQSAKFVNGLLDRLMQESNSASVPDLADSSEPSETPDSQHP